MAQLNVSSSVGDWAAQCPQTSRVFESLQIDYCCGGGKSLEQACYERQLDPQKVMSQLDEAIKGQSEPLEDWPAAALTELCNHIEQSHHAILRSELPRLEQLIAKVLDAHGANHPELSDVQLGFSALRAELEPHMIKEEQILFPAIRQLDQATLTTTFPFGSVANPIRMMETEHDQAGGALRKIRTLTCDYTPPHDACNTYRAMLDGLRDLESDLHQHIHKENNILFPRAISAESALAGTRIDTASS